MYNLGFVKFCATQPLCKSGWGGHCTTLEFAWGVGKKLQKSCHERLSLSLDLNPGPL
jgi:hypothetical protein